MEFNQEENNEQEFSEESNEGGMKQWLQDNLRIIISILIVVLIAGGIYSYSKRTETPELAQEVKLEESSEVKSPEMTLEKDESTKTETAKTETAKSDASQKTSSVSVSQETEKTFIETAVKGDSKTKLARKALANYLEKNPDSSLKAEHKIYIEDYLRKNVKSSNKVLVGTSVEFSKDMIAGAISLAKSLNERQIQNLHKYAVRVPSLS